MPETEGESLTVELTVLQELVVWFADSWGPEEGTWSVTLVASAPVVDSGSPDTGAPPRDTDAPDTDDTSPPETDDTGTSDQRVPPPGEQVDLSGCGCSSPGGLAPVLLPALLGMMGLTRRRRPHNRI